MAKRSIWERRQIQQYNIAALVDEQGQPRFPCPDFIRASGDCVCEKCGEVYYDHPVHMPYHWLTVICTGLVVKT